MGHKDLRLGQIVYILVFYSMSFPWLLSPDGFQFNFLLRDSENDLYDKISSSHTEIPVGKPRSRELRQPALSYEPIENFTKDLEVRRDLGNRASLVNWAHVKRP